MPNYQKLKTMVKRNSDQKLLPRNFDARHGKLETGAVVKSRKGLSGVEGGKGTCDQWIEEGQCSKGDKCSFRHESNDRAQKPEHNAATPSEPSMTRGRSVSKKRSIQGKSNHGAILRQRPDYLKGTCTRSPCGYWHPPGCQFYKTETVYKAADKCLFPHLKVDEQANKKPIKGNCSTKDEKATTRMQGPLRKLYHTWVASRKTLRHRFLKEANSSGEIRCKVLEKYKSNLLISEVPTL